MTPESGKKHDAGKPRLELVPWRAVDQSREAKAFTVREVVIAIGTYLEGGPAQQLLNASHSLLYAEGSSGEDMLIEVAKVLTFGAAKYGEHNWRKGGTLTQTRVLGAALRHLLAHLQGERLDAETGLSHLAHAECEILFAITYALEGRGDDRWAGTAVGSSAKTAPPATVFRTNGAEGHDCPRDLPCITCGEQASIYGGGK